MLIGLSTNHDFPKMILIFLSTEPIGVILNTKYMLSCTFVSRGNQIILDVPGGRQIVTRTLFTFLKFDFKAPRSKKLCLRTNIILLKDIFFLVNFVVRSPISAKKTVIFESKMSYGGGNKKSDKKVLLII